MEACFCCGEHLHEKIGDDVKVCYYIVNNHKICPPCYQSLLIGQQYYDVEDFR